MLCKFYVTFSQVFIVHTKLDKIPECETVSSWITRRTVKRQSKSRLIVRKQSGTSNDKNIMKVSAESDYQNVKFNDQHEPYLYDVDGTSDPTRSVTDMNDASLENFFSRPLKIGSFNWATSTSFYQAFDPWSLYFNNPRVINRISNYNLMRCKLHVKFVINGNGFQYGRLIASYLPLRTLDDLSTNALLVPEDIVQSSQLPHVYLDPTTSSGGEMVLPFFFFNNNCNIPGADWNVLGETVIRSINGLKHANGATDVVTVSVFAWAEDVQLSVLTSNDPFTIVPQSGREGDEIDEANKEGIVSGPATKLAKAAGALSIIPQIRPFATATATAASAVGAAAKAFGYCRPPVTKDSEPFKPVPISDLAVTNNPDCFRKLTIDSKQELSIDPRIAGLGSADPMNIREIAKRESYLTKFSWNIGTSVETLLWNTRISPISWAESGVTPVGFHFPACAMAAMPFKFWTGSITYRFQIVCSSFHKGRLKVVYDPKFLVGSEYNTNYLQVIDIADQTDFSITIGNGQQNSLLDHLYPGLNSVTECYSTTAYTATGPGNGVLGVYVVNELTTPNSTVNNDIEVNVYVSAGDDFEVFVPESHFQKFVVKPQSGKEPIVPESQNTMEPSAPEHDQTETLGPQDTNHDLLNHVFVGEAISSFRTLLKRYNLHTAIGDSTTGDRIINIVRSGLPYFRGNVQGAVDTTSLAAPYNYCNTVLIHWVLMAFSGYRGSIRWKYLPLSGFDNVSYTVERESGKFTTDAYSNLNTPAANFTTLGSAGYLTLDPTFTSPGTRGSAFQNSNVNPTIEFEVPYYNQFRFCPAKIQNLTTTAGLGSWAGSLGVDRYDLDIHVTGKTDGDWLGAYCAAGEDFQVYFWSALPRLYYEAAAPVPS